MDILTLIYEDLLVQIREEEVKQRDSLMSGYWGALLYLFYYEHYCDQARDNATGLLAELYEALDKEGRTGYSLCNGLTGSFWLLHHLNQQNIVLLDIEELMSDFVLAAIEESNRLLRQQNFDFLHGSSGICHFLCHFAHQPAVRKHLEVFVTKLKEVSRTTPSGMSLPTFIYSSAKADERDTKGVEMLSLAHGTCSLQIILSHIHSVGIAQDACKDLIYKSIQFVLQHKCPYTASNSLSRQSVYPSSLDGKYPWSRLAWCYGDMSVAMAFWYCGNYWKEESWKKEALAILQYNIQRVTLDDAGVSDACFCHGTAGVAVMYRKLWQETGIKAFYNCSEHWYKQTIAKVFLSSERTGYEFLKDVNKGQQRYDLLSGTAGIGLALLSRGQHMPLHWYNCFLLDNIENMR